MTKLSDIPNLPVRIEHVARHFGVETLEELSLIPDAEIVRLPNIGRKSLVQMNKIYQEYGVDILRDTHRRLLQIETALAAFLSNMTALRKSLENK